MSTLLLRLTGPMQSWGIQSRYTERDTGLEPSKSGVVGLICSALGISRDDEARIGEIAALRMGVRIEREGILRRDYQTAGGGKWAWMTNYGVYKADGSTPKTVVSNRYYLSDAYFLVALSGNADLLQTIQRGLMNPVWPVFLGRKSYVPSEPIWIDGGILPENYETVLNSYPWQCPQKNVTHLRLVLECTPQEGAIPRQDQPVSFSCTRRRYSVRYVKTSYVEVMNLQQKEED